MGLGLGEIIMLLFIAVAFAAIFGAFYFLAKHLTLIGGKTCPHCAERIKKAAKICRYCHREVTGI